MGTHPCYPYEYTDGGWGNNTRIREVDKDIYIINTPNLGLVQEEL